MSYLIEIPVEGGSLVVEAGPSQLPGDLDLAACRPGDVVAHATEALERSLDQLKPAVTAVARRLRAIHPDAFSVELGVVLGAECGLFVARGSSEAHLMITFSWNGANDPGGGFASEDD
jgi:hypothetical protein